MFLLIKMKLLNNILQYHTFVVLMSIIAATIVISLVNFKLTDYAFMYIFKIYMIFYRNTRGSLPL